MLLIDRLLGAASSSLREADLPCSGSTILGFRPSRGLYSDFTCLWHDLGSDSGLLAKPIYGYAFVAGSSAVIVLLSYGVWRTTCLQWALGWGPTCSLRWVPC